MTQEFLLRMATQRNPMDSEDENGPMPCDFPTHVHEELDLGPPEFFSCLSLQELNQFGTKAELRERLRSLQKIGSKQLAWLHAASDRSSTLERFQKPLTVKWHNKRLHGLRVDWEEMAADSVEDGESRVPWAVGEGLDDAQAAEHDSEGEEPDANYVSAGVRMESYASAFPSPDFDNGGNANGGPLGNRQSEG